MRTFKGRGPTGCSGRVSPRHKENGPVPHQRSGDYTCRDHSSPVFPSRPRRGSHLNDVQHGWPAPPGPWGCDPVSVKAAVRCGEARKVSGPLAPPLAPDVSDTIAPCGPPCGDLGQASVGFLQFLRPRRKLEKAVGRACRRGDEAPAPSQRPCPWDGAARFPCTERALESVRSLPGQSQDVYGGSEGSSVWVSSRPAVRRTRERSEEGSQGPHLTRRRDRGTPALSQALPQAQTAAPGWSRGLGFQVAAPSRPGRLANVAAPRTLARIPKKESVLIC